MLNEKDVFPEWKQRSHYEILSSLLEYCASPQKISHIYYHQRGTYPSVKQLVSEALEAKLLKRVGKKYITTPRGKQFIQQWSKILTMLRKEENVPT